MVAREMGQRVYSSLGGVPICSTRFGPGRSDRRDVPDVINEPDIFIIKKHGREVAERNHENTREVSPAAGVETFDAECIEKGKNPGSKTHITIAIFLSH